MFQKGAITAIFKSDSKDFNRGLKDVNKSLENLGSRGKRVADTIADLDRRKQTVVARMRELKSQNKEGSASYQRLGDRVKNLNDRMETSRMRLKEMGDQGQKTAWFMSPDYFKTHLLANALGDLVSNGIQLAIDKLFELGRSFFEVGLQAEQTEIAFEVMLGSAEAGQKMLADISNLAKKTPFEIPGLENTAKSLLGMGFSAEEILPTLDVLGDISSGVGTGKLPFLTLALSQVRTAGKLTGAELRQFSENGVPLLEGLAKNAGVSMGAMRESISDGAIVYEDVIKVLEGLTQEGGRFFNLMERQSETLGGRWSNMVDTATIKGRELFKKLRPTFHKVLDMVENISTFVDENIHLLIDNAGLLASMLTGFLVGVAIVKTIAGFAALSASITAAGGIAAFVGANLAVIFSPAVLIIAGLVALGALLYLAWENDFMAIQDIVESFGRKLKEVWEVVMANLIPSLQSLWSETQQLWDLFVSKLTPALQPLLEGLMSFKSVWDSIVYVFRDMLMPLLMPLANFLLFLATQALSALIYAWRLVSPPLMDFINSVVELISTLMEVVSIVMTFLLPVIIVIIGILGVLIAFIITILVPVFQILWGFIVQAFTGILKIITGVIDIVIGIFEIFIGIATGIFTGDFSRVVEGFKKVFSGIWKFIEGAIQLVLSPVTGIIEGIRNIFDGLDLYKIGKNIIDGLIRGISNKAQQVQNMVNDMANNIKSSITGAFDINSPSRWMMWAFDMIWDGAIIETKKRENDVAQSSEDMMTAVQKPIAQSVSNMSSINNTNNQTISTTNNNNFKQNVSFNSIDTPSDAMQKQLADKMQTFFQEGIKTVKPI